MIFLILVISLFSLFFHKLARLLEPTFAEIHQGHLPPWEFAVLFSKAFFNASATIESPLSLSSYF
jgi:hypothetical protein